MKKIILVINLLFILCSCYNNLNEGLHFVDVISVYKNDIKVKEVVYSITL